MGPLPPREVGKVASVANLTASGALGTSVIDTDVRLILVNQTTAGLTFTLPNPGDTSAVVSLDVVNVGSAAFTMYGAPAQPNTVLRLVWTGSAWDPDVASLGILLTNLVLASASNTNVYCSNGTMQLQAGGSNGSINIGNSSGVAQIFAALNALQGLATPMVNSGPLAGFRNRIINGNFAVNQRNYTSGTALAAGAYAHDRWKAGSGGCTYTFTQTVPDTPITLSSGTLLQIIEGCHVDITSGVLSWVGSATARVYQGTAASQSSPAYSAGTAVTVNGIATNQLAFGGLTAGTNTVVEFSGGSVSKVQFECGGFATPFERRSLATEINQCQRYFAQSTGAAGAVLAETGYVGVAAGKNFATVAFSQTMASVPTMALVGTYAFTNGSAATLTAGSTSTFVLTWTGTAVGATAVSNPAGGGYSASAEL